MRNDNNMSVVVKSERVSSSQARVSNSRDSLKENSNPKEGPTVPAEVAKENLRRSQSVEIIPTKPVEIDITHDDSDRMPPPPLPPKQKKTKAKKHEEIDPTKPLPLRVTRSKIKKEKVSVDKTQSEATMQEVNTTAAVRKSQSENSVLQKTVDTTVTQSKGKAKKYPMPILVKIERTSEELKAKKRSKEKQPVEEAPKRSEEVPVADKKSIENEEVISPLNQVNNQTFDLPNANETVTISPALINNETITLEQAPAGNINNETVTLDRNPNDSLMTEDNDEEENASMNIPLAQVAPVPLQLKLKKNEVFKWVDSKLILWQFLLTS